LTLRGIDNQGFCCPDISNNYLWNKFKESLLKNEGGADYTTSGIGCFAIPIMVPQDYQIDPAHIDVIYNLIMLLNLLSPEFNR
jgi:hypothetical protein